MKGKELLVEYCRVIFICQYNDNNETFVITNPRYNYDQKVRLVEGK